MFGVAGTEGPGTVDAGHDRSSKQSRDGSVASRPGFEKSGSGKGIVRQQSSKTKTRTSAIAAARFLAASKIDTTRAGRNQDRRGAPSRPWDRKSVSVSSTTDGLAALEISAVQDAVQRERRRIARDLHDHAGQYLVGISLRLAALEQSLADTSVSCAFSDLRHMLSRFGDEIRAISAGERRGVPEGCQMSAALRNLAAQWECETGIAVCFYSDSTDGIEPDSATAEVIFRIAQEALTNIAKHATGAAHVKVRLQFAADVVRLAIEDDGPGLYPACGHETGRPARRGGIINMQERLAERGGQLAICCPPEGGTYIVATVPIGTHQNSGRNPCHEESNTHCSR